MNETYPVIIIGAGSAGIGACLSLKYKNIHSIILESTSCIGGRIKQVKLTKNLINESCNNYVMVDIGANWLHEMTADNIFYTLAKRMNLKLYKTSSDNNPSDDIILYDKNIQLDNLQYKEYINILNIIKQNYKKYNNISILEALQKISNKLKLSDKFKRFLNWYFDRISIDLNYPISKLDSSLFYGNKHSDGINGECLIEGGFFQLIEKISKNIDIKYNHKVIEIYFIKNKTYIKCENNLIYKCYKCILTVPISILKTIIFKPIEPIHITQITNKYDLGLMNIIWIWYPTCFWNEIKNKNFIGITRELNDDHPTFTIFLIPKIYDNYGVKQNILMCQTYGKFALDIETMTNKEIATMATDCLRKIFKDVPDAVGCICSKWNKDIGGSWSYIKNINISVLKQTKIFYTGEALSDNFRGTVHGAFIEGCKCVNKYF